jgi:hypothetical protein
MAGVVAIQIICPFVLTPILVESRSKKSLAPTDVTSILLWLVFKTDLIF